jgi:hypothetical protein
MCRLSKITEVAQFFVLLFSTVKATYKWVRLHILGDFLTSSSGHPVCDFESLHRVVVCPGSCLISGSGLPDGMYIFIPKIPILGKFWRVLQWKMLVYFMAIWSILRPFFVYFTALWYIFWPFGKFWFIEPLKIWQPCSGCQMLFWFETFESEPSFVSKRLKNTKSGMPNIMKR